MFDLVYTLNALHFQRPWWLLGMVPLVLCIFYIRRLNGADTRWKNVIAPHLLRALTVGGGGGHWFNPVTLSLTVVLLGTLVMAGPSWERQPSPLVEDEAGLVVALDLSSSMNQVDVQPSRLERAKQKIEDLLALRGGSPSGLIVYAGSAHQVIPLTNDRNIISNYLGALSTEMMPRPGKLPEKVLMLADRVLQGTEVPGTLLLVGDGAARDSQGAFRDYFDGAKHQLLVLGIGLEALPEARGGESGLASVHRPLQADKLKQLAKAAGGDYQPLTVDQTDVRRIDRLINLHVSNSDDSLHPWVDAGYYLLYPFALFVLFWFRKGWTLHWVLVLVLFGSGGYSQDLIAASPVPNEVGGQAGAVDRSGRWRWFIDLWLTPDQQGRYYFERGDYQMAAQRFRDPEWKGIAHYYNENFAAAVELFAQLDSTEGLFNLANAQAQGQHYLLAVKTYDRVLRRQAQHRGATANRARVQRVIDDINRMSESQKAEAGEASDELGDAPQRADGAEEQVMVPREIKQFTAEQVLADQRVHEMWMRQVQQDPARFLRVKFQMQLNGEEGRD